MSAVEQFVAIAHDEGDVKDLSQKDTILPTKTKSQQTSGQILLPS